MTCFGGAGPPFTTHTSRALRESFFVCTADGNCAVARFPRRHTRRMKILWPYNLSHYPGSSEFALYLRPVFCVSTENTICALEHRHFFPYALDSSLPRAYTLNSVHPDPVFLGGSLCLAMSFIAMIAKNLSNSSLLSRSTTKANSNAQSVPARKSTRKWPPSLPSRPRKVDRRIAPVAVSFRRRVDVRGRSAVLGYSP